MITWHSGTNHIQEISVTDDGNSLTETVKARLVDCRAALPPMQRPYAQLLAAGDVKSIDLPCAVYHDGALRCLVGQYSTVTDIATDVAALTGGCFLKRDGTAFCDSSTWSGATKGAVAELKQVPFPSKVLAIDASYQHLCAILDDHSLWCLGASGALESGKRAFTTATRKPQCALDGTCEAPGSFGPTQYTLEPTKVDEVDGVVAIGIAANRTCVITRNGKLVCLGEGHETPLVVDVVK